VETHPDTPLPLWDNGCGPGASLTPADENYSTGFGGISVRVAWNVPEMKIKQVSVTELFGVFDHVIPFNMDEHITIIHGSNGLGKTALLRMINGLFNNRYSELRSIPFLAFQIYFDNGASIRIKRSSDAKEDESKSKLSQQGLVAEITHTPGEMPTLIELGGPRRIEEMRMLLHYLDNVVAGVERIGQDQWRVHPTGETLSSEDLVERYWDHIPPHVLKELELPPLAGDSSQGRDWLNHITSQIDVRFIETQRLVAWSRTGRKRGYESTDRMTPVVAMYSEELATIIQKKFSEYAGLSQSLDQTFPRRVIYRDLGATLSLEELRDKLKSLDEKRERLTEAGLLEKEPHFFAFEGVPTSIDDVTRSVLSVYAADMDKKLSVFNDVTDKIELVKQFVEDHFLQKELLVSKEKGFTLKSTKTDQPLEPTQLSSGEQHELVLLYELLFRIKPNSLILIDEPEISLHVDWQTRFLEDLKNVIRLSPFDALIATHSPQIINTRWDLTVELEAK
jgi:predicted ATP-binding protein involved in virulence